MSPLDTSAPRPVVSLRGLTRVYRMGDALVTALDRMDLDIARGAFFGVVGRSGSGKSTFLNLLGGLDTPTEGTIEVDGLKVTGASQDALAAYRRDKVGFIFQQFNLIRGLSAVENIILPGYPGGTPRAQLLARAEALLADLQLAHRRDAKVEWLSGGEQQRVAICRALINDPEVLVADEPTANLDSTLSAEFLAILRRLAEAGRTVILTSHDPLVVESEVVDRVYSLRDGRLIEVVDTRKAWP